MVSNSSQVAMARSVFNLQKVEARGKAADKSFVLKAHCLACLLKGSRVDQPYCDENPSLIHTSAFSKPVAEAFDSHKKLVSLYDGRPFRQP